MKTAMLLFLFAIFIITTLSVTAANQNNIQPKGLIYKFTLSSDFSPHPPPHVIIISKPAKYVTCWAYSAWQCTQDVNMSWNMQVGGTKAQSHTYPGPCNRDDPKKYGPIRSSLTLPLKNHKKVSVQLIPYSQASVGAINFECWGHDKKVAF